MPVSEIHALLTPEEEKAVRIFWSDSNDANVYVVDSSDPLIRVKAKLFASLPAPEPLVPERGEWFRHARNGNSWRGCVVGPTERYDLDCVAYEHYSDGKTFHSVQIMTVEAFTEKFTSGVWVVGR